MYITNIILYIYIHNLNILPLNAPATLENFRGESAPWLRTPSNTIFTLGLIWDSSGIHPQKDYSKK